MARTNSPDEPPDPTLAPAPNFFAGAAIERRAEERMSDTWLRDALGDAATRILVARGSAQLLTREPPGLAFLPPDHPRVRAAPPDSHVLLGWVRDARYVLLLDDDAPDVLADNAVFDELRPLASGLPAEEAALLAYARALSIWRANHRYCGTCGTPTQPTRAGHALLCPQCERESFPRIDPAIIVLVTDGERALLGRQPSWAPRRYSTIAGFVEPGESLEDAVAREVLEETGIAVRGVTYHSSQPWPFPSALMLGFLAHAALSPAPAPAARDGELEDARWFARDAVTAGEILLPPETSISRRLVDHWLQGWPAFAPPA